MFKIKELLNLITGLWAKTEPDLSQLSHQELLDIIEEISLTVDAIGTIIEEELIVCSHCEGDIVSICEPCLSAMSE